MVDSRPRRRLLVLLILMVTPVLAFGQMDMLPQIFRDLPPEFESGLPEEMTFAEYRALNRNVDFFTMFMSMFVPGYGLFSVERPDLAWPVVGARAAGYGMMTSAVVLQWNHFGDLFSGQQLSSEDFNRLLTNWFIFGGGVVVTGLSWAADVVLAYQVAKEEKNLVQYTYGVRATHARSSASDQQEDERYLRGLLRQPGDRRVREELLRALPRHAARFPDSSYAGEALYFAALIYAEQHNDIDALRYALRSAYVYPDGPRSADTLRLVARLFERNPSWDATFELASGLVDLPSPGTDAELRLIRLANKLYASPLVSLREIGVSQARYVFDVAPHTGYAPEVLATVAYGYELVGRHEEAAQYYAMLVLRHLDSDLWAESALRLLRLYDGPLDDPDRARVLANALAERAPDSPQAREAGDR